MDKPRSYTRQGPLPVESPVADRAIALLVLASDCRVMIPEPQHVLALIDFLHESEDSK
jgi:hypothetical protein